MKKKGCMMKCLMICFFISFASASEWARRDEEFNTMDELIEFDNRASCAKKSNEPTKSVFLIVDNVNMAKSIYRLTKIKGMNSTQTINEAIFKFNVGLTSIITLISNRLLNGDLPFVEDSKLSDTYLRDNWNSKRLNDLKSYSKCRIHKKISSLFSHLNVTKPDRDLILKLAKDINEKGNNFQRCDSNIDNNSELSLFQFDVEFKKGIDGFKFWYSLKVYLSWAFRNAPELTSYSAPFDFIFKSLDLEEMILFFSKSCRSITMPECSAHELNLNQLKNLTLESDKFNLASYAPVKPVSYQETQDLISSPLPLKEDDLLHLGTHENTSEWISNFRENFTKVRGFQKLQLTKALTQIYLIHKFKGAENIEKNVMEEVELNSFSFGKDLYYMCSEFKIATDKDLSYLLKDLLLLKNDKYMSVIYSDIFNEDFISSFSNFKLIYEKINQICKSLDESNFWVHVSDTHKKGFSTWYQELLSKEGLFSLERIVPYQYIPIKPSLKFKNGEVICYSGIHCARVLLDSMMTLSSLTKSINTIMTSKAVLSSNMSNPYTSHRACGAYDPWAKKNKMIFDFFHDLIQGSLFGFLPSPIYVSAEVQDKKVVSFSTLVKDGKIFYDPKYDPKKINLSLIADLGPLTGIPCAISISGSPVNPLEYYSFGGISLNSCSHHSKVEIEAHDANDIQIANSKRSFCASCAINLHSLSSSVGVLNPALRFSFFLLKGITRLVSNLRDSQDLIKSWQLSTHQVALSYRFHGNISQSCVKRLLNGRSCLPKICESKMMEELTRKFKVSPLETDFSCFFNKGTVWIKECSDPIYLSNPTKLKIETNCSLEERVI